MDSKGKMKMALDEAIKILREHNTRGASVQRITGGRFLEKDLLEQVLNACEQFVTERTEFKRLLKSAAKIVNSSLCCDDDLCSECVHSEECKYSVDYDRCFEWKYKNTEEYKKLIGGSENG